MHDITRIRPPGAVVNDIDITMARAGIVEVNDDGGLLYADGVTVHLSLAVVLELVLEHREFVERLAEQKGADA